MAKKFPKNNGDDTMTGSSGSDTLDGGNGNDVLYGGGGADKLLGGNGNDQLWGEDGDDELEGGNGNDMLYGGLGLDELEGGRGDDLLDGGEGDDELEGGNGDDMLTGGQGLDELEGGSGDDMLDGGEGNDELDGGKGDDVLTGGAGADVFEMSCGDDTITDFSPLKKTGVLIDFEDVAPINGESFIPDAYKNLDWDNAGAVDTGMFYYPGSGYEIVSSGTDAGFNWGAAEMYFSDLNNDFDFKGGYFAAAWNNDLNVTFTAWDDGLATGTLTVQLDPVKEYIDFSTIVGFTSIDKVTISSTGGINAGLNGSGMHVAMDDLMLTYVSGEGDTIDVDDDVDINTLIASATYDLDGDVVLHHDGGSLTLVGVTNAAEVSADWFV